MSHTISTCWDLRQNTACIRVGMYTKMIIKKKHNYTIQIYQDVPHNLNFLGFATMHRLYTCRYVYPQKKST